MSSSSPDVVERASGFVRQTVRVPFYLPVPATLEDAAGACVFLSGSWDSWEARIPMFLVGNHYEVFLSLKAGMYMYKFLINDAWVLAPHQAEIADEHGHVNHVVSVTHPSASCNALSDLANAPASPSPRPHPAASAPASPRAQDEPLSVITDGLGSTYHTPAASPSPRRRSRERDGAEDLPVHSLGGRSSRTALLSRFNAGEGEDGSGSMWDGDDTTASDHYDSEDEELAQSLASVTHPLVVHGGPGYGPAILKNQLMLDGVYRVDNSNIARAGERKLVIAMCGLPARGKSFIAQKLRTYLKWIGWVTKIFNNGTYRRDNIGSYLSHDFFRPDNREGVAARSRMAKMALHDMCEWLRADSKHHIGILDATNSTRARRKFIMEYLKNVEGISVKVVFLEIICNRPEVIKRNVLHKWKFSPDYQGMTQEEAVADFEERIVHYEAAYEPVQERTISFIRLFDVGRETQTNRIKGYLPTRIVFFLMNMHIVQRPIYLSRHGESQFNCQDRIGGDSPLTKKGLKYAERLGKYILEETTEDTSGYLRDLETDLVVFTSTMVRTIQTSEEIQCAQLLRWKALEEISVGICDGMTPAEFEATYPEEYNARVADKLNYTYPRGESYRDLIARLEPVIIELERQVLPVLIIGHQAVLRCLYGYLMGLDIEDVPHTPIPLHTVIKLTPKAYGTQESRHLLYDLESEAAQHSGSIHADSPLSAVVSDVDLGFTDEDE